VLTIAIAEAPAAAPAVPAATAARIDSRSSAAE
jgi:hypothetical protein